MTRVLVIADDLHLRRFVRISLGVNGYEVVEAETLGRGLELVRSAAFDLVVATMDECEALMPEVTGEGRGLGPVPLILLSRVPLGAKRAVAPELPAGVSVVRPFAIAELLSRVHAALGQPQDVDGDEVLQAGNVRMDFTRRVITKCGREVRLSRREYDLLQCLAANPDHVVEQRQILKAVWGEGHMDDTHYLRVHMRQLRRKLEDHPAAPCLLVTEPGVGYRLCIHG